ncbi:MAG: molybdopterin-dependent oxidoreductase [Gemmatimonadota bacterium]
MSPQSGSTPNPKRQSRREFLAGGALLGSSLVLPGTASGAVARRHGAVLRSDRPDAPYDLADPGNVIHSTCLQCNTGCGIKCKIQDGVLTKIDGNPYSPWTLVPHLREAVPLDDAVAVDGAICPKGQAGLQTAYDPYRLRRVLKRAGRRGENRWVSMPFEQAVREICEGGRLFADAPGEEDRVVEGLDQIMALRDPAVAKEMAADVDGILAEEDRARKQALVEAFKRRHADHLDVLIDPDHPDLGPKNNQILMAYGRLKAGRSEFYKRFAAGLGSVNLHGHTTVCQGSLYFTCKAISEQYDTATGEFGGGSKFYWQADTENSRFILFVGANLFEANYGPPNRSPRLTNNLVSGRVKVACADPRFSKLASKSWRWLPLKPGTDTALAMAMIRWMLDNDRFDRDFVSCANRAAANANGDPSWVNATWLVDVTEGRPGGFVRARDVGLAYGNELVVMVDGRPVAFDPNDATRPVHGDLYADTTLPDGTAVKTGLQLLREECHRHTIEEWCRIADVRPRHVIDVARELTSHGKRAAVDIHRGPAQHTNGFYNVLAWMTINMLLGNFDHKGGMCKASSWDIEGKGGWFQLKDQPGKATAFGISAIRHDVDYEQTTLFEGYPARRNWYPLSSDVYEEIIPSMGDAYPYPIKAFFLYMGAPTYALPAGHTNIEILCDLATVPLFVASDILVGPTSMYADYIFPDTSYLERWEFQKSHPNMTWKSNPIRQPVIAPIPEACTVFGETQPICFETMMLGIAEQMGLPGFGEEGFGNGTHLRHMDEFMLRCVGNIAFGEKPDGSQNLPEADHREMELFLSARRHLPASVFDPDRWRRIVGEEMWPRVVYALNRGGRFEDHELGYDGDLLAHPHAAQLSLYQEKTASKIHSGTGEHHPGLATWMPVRDFHGNEPHALRDGYGLAMITNRTIVHTKSRTIADPWLSALMPENGIQVHPTDAQRLGLEHGQEVRVVSATNTAGEWPLGNGRTKPMVGKVQITQQVRPGVISFPLGFGHWATGAADMLIDGHTVQGEPRRAKGIHANAAMWVDPALKNTCMIDPVGGSVSFYDTHVKLVPVAG